MENLAKNPYSQSVPMDNELKIHRRRYSQVSDGTGSDKSLLPAALSRIFFSAVDEGSDTTIAIDT